MSDTSTTSSFSLEGIRNQMEGQLASLNDGIANARERKTTLAAEREAFIEGQRKERETHDANIKKWVAEADQIERALRGMEGPKSRQASDEPRPESTEVVQETPADEPPAPAFQPV